MRNYVAAALVACSIFVLPGNLGAQQLSAEGDIPGMKVMVQELKRDEGGTLTLRFQLVNESDQRLADSCAFRETGNDTCGPISGVHLIDAANKKKYFVVRDSDKKCVCSTFRNVEKGGRMNHWAKFPAPPAGVQKITVIVPQFQPVEGVPITGP